MMPVMQCVDMLDDAEVRHCLHIFNGLTPEFVVNAFSFMEPAQYGRAELSLINHHKNRSRLDIKWREQCDDVVAGAEQYGRYLGINLIRENGKPVVRIADCFANHSSKRQGFARRSVAVASLMADYLDTAVTLEPYDDGEVIWPHLGARKANDKWMKFTRGQVRDIAALTRQALCP